MQKLNMINKIIEENEHFFLSNNNIRSIFLDNIRIKEETFKGKKSLLFDGENISFQNVFFQDCSLGNSILRKKSSFVNNVFLNCNLSKVFFEGKILHSIFIDCNFFETEFVGINIENTVFINSDFSSFFLSNSQLKNCKFINNRNANEDCIFKNIENNVIWI